MTTFSIPTRRHLNLYGRSAGRYSSVDPVQATKLIKYKTPGCAHTMLVEYKVITATGETIYLNCEIGRAYWRKLRDDQKEDLTNA